VTWGPFLMKVLLKKNRFVLFMGLTWKQTIDIESQNAFQKKKKGKCKTLGNLSVSKHILNVH